ncbi:aldo/keto reductase, partial [Campylobacter troglodytis]|uniref:aldo/keto reductase n=1 Tax=Campylobacter troglodytis TaxID=654363 RepID=UPI001159E550
KSYEAARASIEQSLAKLGLDYIDLMLIHAPQPWNDFRGGDYFEGNAAAWRALEEAYKEGKVRAIGVSNFLQKDLANIFANCSVKPVVNQVLCHIGNTPFELIKHCKNEGLLIQAYSPIAHGELLKDERLMKIAANYGVSVPQLCIRYCLELGVCP